MAEKRKSKARITAWAIGIVAVLIYVIFIIGGVLGRYNISP